MRLRPSDLLLGALALALLSGSVGLVRNRFSAEPLPLLAPYRVPVPPGVTTVDLETARRFLDDGDVLFVDAREVERYREGHLPGALSLPAEELEDYAKGQSWETVLFTLRTTPRVVVYCDGPECHASERLAEALQKAGVPNVSLMPEGWPAWEAAGLPASREGAP